jgi:hypothetical protein
VTAFFSGEVKFGMPVTYRWTSLSTPLSRMSMTLVVPWTHRVIFCEVLISRRVDFELRESGPIGVCRNTMPGFDRQIAPEI